MSHSAQVAGLCQFLALVSTAEAVRRVPIDSRWGFACYVCRTALSGRCYYEGVPFRWDPAVQDVTGGLSPSALAGWGGLGNLQELLGFAPHTFQGCFLQLFKEQVLCCVLPLIKSLTPRLNRRRKLEAGWKKGELLLGAPRWPWVELLWLSLQWGWYLFP